MDWCTTMYVVKAIGGKIHLGQYNGIEVGAPHATATTSVPAFARGGESMTSLTRANCLLQRASSAETSVVCYDITGV